jgi:hypothetical protein
MSRWLLGLVILRELLQLQHALRLRTMTNQVEHQVKVKMGKTRKAA